MPSDLCGTLRTSLVFLVALVGLIGRWPTHAIAWVWTNGAVVGALTAALFTAIYVWLTHQILRHGRTPVVTVQDFTRTGILEGDHQLRSLRNSGQGPAFNVCIHQQGQSDTLEWLGSLGPGEIRERPRPVAMNYVEDHPHYIWYQDSGRRWYVSRVAAMGYGPSSVWEGRRRSGIPRTVRLNARAETVVQYYNRLGRNKLRKLLDRLKRSN